MNQRIRKLVEEAGFVGYGEESGMYNIPVLAFRTRMETLAELIITECIKEIETFEVVDPYTEPEQRKACERNDLLDDIKELIYERRRFSL